MIKFEHAEVVGWEAAIRGMRNPLESWDRSDSLFLADDGDYYNLAGDSGPHRFDEDPREYIGIDDLDLMKRLRNAGTADHRKFMRMIVVYVDITAPLYFWKEMDQYRVGQTTNSCSTMHCIAKDEFTLEDFSHEHLTLYEEDGELCRDWLGDLEDLIYDLNFARKKYLETKDKKYWWQMIQLLPSSYNQKRTVMLNYEVLVNIYKSRKGHRLDEWRVDFINWIKSLPYCELITGKG